MFLNSGPVKGKLIERIVQERLMVDLYLGITILDLITASMMSYPIDSLTPIMSRIYGHSLEV